VGFGTHFIKKTPEILFILAFNTFTALYFS
jgi:hypothetical protein